MDFTKESNQIKDMFSRSRECFIKGLEYFNSTNSTSNQALLNANLGGLARLCAQTYCLLHHEEEEEEGVDNVCVREVSVVEERYCKEAIMYYSKGQELLKRAKTDRSIWYSLEYDLAGVYFTLGQQLQERPPLSRKSMEEIEREVLSHYMKALHHAESSYTNTPSDAPNHIILSKFIGNCHQALGSLYNKVVSTMPSASVNSQKLKFSQAEKHYNKALQYYSNSHHRPQVIRVLLEKAFIYEQESSNAKGVVQLRLLNQSLDTLLSVKDVLEEETMKPSEETAAEPSSDRIDQLLEVLVQRLQTVLKQLLVGARKGYVQQCCKEMYLLAIRTELCPDHSCEGVSTTATVSVYKTNQLLKQLENIYKQTK